MFVGCFGLGFLCVKVKYNSYCYVWGNGLFFSELCVKFLKISFIIWDKLYKFLGF